MFVTQIISFLHTFGRLLTLTHLPRQVRCQIRHAVEAYFPATLPAPTQPNLLFIFTRQQTRLDRFRIPRKPVSLTLSTLMCFAKATAHFHTYIILWNLK